MRKSLPESTDEQQIASGFNRNHRINNEGGANPWSEGGQFIQEQSSGRLPAQRVGLGFT
jgi:hypothetical protein